MFTHHKVAFVTFHSDDGIAARRYIAKLVSLFPRIVFKGRHISDKAEYIQNTLASSTLTLVLETERTFHSSEVLRDVEASLAKLPPNALLRLQLGAARSPDSSALGSALGMAGTEVVRFEPASIESAIQRSEDVYKVQPKLAISAKASSFGGNCNR